MEKDTNPQPKSGSSYFPLALVLLAVILFGGLAFVFRHKIKTMISGDQTAQPVVSQTVPAVANPTTAPVQGASEVDYDGSAFSPASLTVKVGTTVKFVNKSADPMSVASNPHPTHTDYPGFDQYKSTFKGQNEYDFTFDKVGTWGYHNHLSPSQGGTVVVTQ